jgi:proline racemase
MSQAAVRAKLGKPLKVVHAKNDFGSYTELRFRGYVVDFQGNSNATAVITTSSRERTPSGIGVGSAWSQVRARIPHVHCEGTPTLGDCHVGELLPGKRVTDFFFRGGKVTRVVVGIVID